MTIRPTWTIGGAVAVTALVGGLAVGIGSGDRAAATSANAADDSEPKAGDTYTFVDTDLTRDEQTLNYSLPKLPPGPYSVSLFAGLEPTDGAANENLYCQVNDATRLRRILVATTRSTGESATFVSGASAARVRQNSELKVICEAEHGPFRFVGDPLRVTFVRLASMQTTVIEPD